MVKCQLSFVATNLKDSMGVDQGEQNQSCARMHNECKRIWLYALVIEREARMQDYIIKSQIS